MVGAAFRRRERMIGGWVEGVGGGGINKPIK